MSRGEDRPFTLTRFCQRNGCKIFANHVPELCIPVRGHPQMEPFTVLIAVELCKEHMAQQTARDYLTALVRGGARHFMRAAGAEPDFDNAYLRPVHIMAKEYLKFQRQQRGELEKGETVLWDNAVNPR